MKVLGAQQRPTDLITKSMKYSTAYEYFDLFGSDTQNPLFLLGPGGPHRISNMCLAHPADFEEAKKRWPFLTTYLIIRNSHPAIMIRYGRGFACSPAHISRSVMVSSW